MLKLGPNKRSNIKPIILNLMVQGIVVQNSNRKIPSKLRNLVLAIKSSKFCRTRAFMSNSIHFILTEPEKGLRYQKKKKKKIKRSYERDD